MLCESMVGVVGHASLKGLHFDVAHPAPACASAVLQLVQALKRYGRGSVFKFEGCSGFLGGAAVSTEGLSAFDKFAVALQACGL